MLRRASLLMTCASALGFAFAGDVLAQQQTAPSPNQLETVVVTAEKRSETVQETPISITAVSEQDIRDRGLTDFTSLAETVPGMAMKSSGPGQTEFELRGMTSSGGNSATVGFYLDDVPLSAPASAQNGKVVIDPNLYDLNRVEVLRGPQGTLYGSGSMGGTIKLVTNQPNLQKFDVDAQVILSGTDGGGFNNGENAMLNIPLISDTLAVRMVGSYQHVSGWIDRIVIQEPDFPMATNGYTVRGNVAAAPVAADYKGVNDEDLTSLRATALWKPTDRLSITPSFLYQSITQDGLSQFDSVPGTLTNYQPFDQAEPFRDRIDIGSLNMQYRFDAFDVTSVTSYWTRDEDLRQDGTEEIQTVLALIGLPLPFYTSQGGAGPTTPTPLEDDKSWQLSEELRLSSSGSGPFQWLLGYYYADFESDWDLYVLQPGAAPIFGTGNAFTQLQPTKIIQNSFFGEASYSFTPQLKFTAGLRRYDYNNEVTTQVSGYLSSTASATVATSNAHESAQGVNPKFQLSYDASKDLLLYATASKGFRPGGANQPIPTSGPLGTGCESGSPPSLQSLFSTTQFVPAPATFAPDSVWSYELGEKWRSNDGRLQINTGVYYSIWKDAQQFLPLSCGFNFSDNVGTADIYGAELELTAILLPGLTFYADGGYTHAKFDASTVPPGIAAVNGLDVQEIPKYTSSLSLVYRHPLGERLGFVARVDNTYTASRTEVTYALYTLPPYALTNARAGIEGNNWSALVFATNVFNKVAEINNAYQINVNVPTYNRVTMAQPLTIGVDLSYRF
jgi:iron complex outermembrane recepter protein